MPEGIIIGLIPSGSDLPPLVTVEWNWGETTDEDLQDLTWSESGHPMHVQPK
jgi:hypothetical protein